MTGSAPPHSQHAAAGGRPIGRGVGVALVDREPMFRDGLAALIAHTAGMHWVGASPDVRTAVVMTERLRPDVLLLDAALDPHCQFVRTLTSMSAALTIVAIVPEEERTTHYLTEAGSAGVHGLVLRSADPALFVECIRRAPLERRFLGPALRALRSESTEAPAHNARLPLSRREYQVLQLIAEGMDNQSIASSLFVSIETIRTHVKGILRKLHARDRAHAISLAYRTGVLSPTEDPHSTSSGGCDLV